MNPNQTVEQAKTKFQAALDHFSEELAKVRTGRAHPGMLDGVTVEAYGTEMPLIQVGSISVPEPQLLQINPFDPGNLAAISAAIRNNQSLGMNPMDDGKVVRVPIPPLNEERRREYVKLVGTKAEEAKISLRNARHDARGQLDQAKKDGSAGEDEVKRSQEAVDKAMQDTQNQIDAAAAEKEREIMTV